jgi:hypothetical protein
MRQRICGDGFAQRNELTARASVNDALATITIYNHITKRFIAIA